MKTAVLDPLFAVGGEGCMSGTGLVLRHDVPASNRAGTDDHKINQSVSDQRPSRVRNDLFDNQKGFDLGKPRWVFMLWYMLNCVFLLSSVPWPSRFKSWLLRRFGAEIGRQVYWKPRVNIHIPWKLKVGDHTWVGEEVCIINFAPVSIGAQCCLSQRSFLCSGNHDYRAESMSYRHAPINLNDGVWVGAGAFIGPGVTVGADAVVTAMSLANHSLAGGWVYAGQPCKAIRRRWVEE